MTPIECQTRLSVLVLGEDTRSFLTVVRSLGKAGFDVYVVCYLRNSPALKSQYIKQAFFYNYQSSTQEDWNNNILALVHRYRFDLVLPCDERAAYPLWQMRQSLPACTQLGMANRLAIKVFANKWLTKCLALRCGVPVSHGKLFHSDTMDFSDIERQFGLPFVLKPLQSFSHTELSERQNVTIIRDKTSFQKWQKNVSGTGRVLVENFFQGNGLGLSVLAVDGKVHAAFAHTRVAEPQSGGGSSYRISTPVDPDLLKQTSALCRESRLTGVAMFEYRQNAEGQTILLEVNCRFWGSLPLAQFAGIDFPFLFSRYLLKKQLPDTPLVTYREKVTARAMTADLYEIKRKFESIRQEEGLPAAVQHVCRRLAEFFRAFTPNETIDSWDKLDPSPFFEESRQLFANLIGSVKQKLSPLRYRRRKLATRSLKLLLQTLPEPRIIFVCYGNIMRSPFAEKALSDALADSAPIDTDSFGFHPQDHRLSPNKAIEAAGTLHIDLSRHRSKWLKQKDLLETDIVIFFDHANRERLLTAYRVNHWFMAADLLGDATLPGKATPRGEIEDPYDAPLESVVDCYKTIRAVTLHIGNLWKGVQA
ncbi:ATP-grasp domain-containing protein [Parasalinivibrio latis]|uniref:arsenate reductase/protein-tyrosine-phosphatase family protein n=1 Tax=Parasalinivibrio latis TaxID=2952610 RepID=UPI0030E5D3CC